MVTTRSINATSRMMRQVVNEDARRTLHAVITFLSCMTEQIHLTLPIINVVLNERGAGQAIAYDLERSANVRCGMIFQMTNTGHYQWKDIC